MKSLLLVLPLLLINLSISAAESTPLRVAMLVSGYGNEEGGNEGDSNISYDLEELAQSYLILQQNGIEIDIVSPKGGSVPVHNKKDDLDYIQTFKNNTPALSQLANTLSAKQATTQQYDGLFIVGGDGAMFDLPFEPDTQTLIKSFIAENKTITAVCHGPAALVNIQMEDGSYFVQNKRVNSFTIREEKAFSSDLLDKFPFMLETELANKGALFVSNQPMLPFVAVDGNLITAQNPMSVAKATEALILKLGQQPVKREPFKDEATLSLISQARNQGTVMIDLALSQDANQFDLNYLALYGFYAYRLAETEQAKQKELTIMATIGQHFSHPQYKQALITAYLQQGQHTKAVKEAESLKAEFPEFKLSKQLSAQLTAAL